MKSLAFGLEFNIYSGAWKNSIKKTVVICNIAIHYKNFITIIHLVYGITFQHIKFGNKYNRASLSLLQARIRALISFPSLAGWHHMPLNRTAVYTYLGIKSVSYSYL